MVPPEDNADRAEEKSQSQRHEEPSAIQALRDACVIATGQEEGVAKVYGRFMQAVDSFTASLRQKEDEFARLSRITEQVTVAETGSGGMPLGIDEAARFETTEISLKQGDVLQYCSARDLMVHGVGCDVSCRTGIRGLFLSRMTRRRTWGTRFG